MTHRGSIDLRADSSPAVTYLRMPPESGSAAGRGAQRPDYDLDAAEIPSIGPFDRDDAIGPAPRGGRPADLDADVLALDRRRGWPLRFALIIGAVALTAGVGVLAATYATVTVPDETVPETAATPANASLQSSRFDEAVAPAPATTAPATATAPRPAVEATTDAGADSGVVVAPPPRAEPPLPRIRPQLASMPSQPVETSPAPQGIVSATAATSSDAPPAPEPATAAPAATASVDANANVSAGGANAAERNAFIDHISSILANTSGTDDAPPLPQPDAQPGAQPETTAASDSGQSSPLFGADAASSQDLSVPAQTDGPVPPANIPNVPPNTTRFQ